MAMKQEGNVKLGFVSIEYIEKGVIEIKYSKKTVIRMDEARVVINSINTLLKGEECSAVFDLTQVRSISRDARAYLEQGTGLKRPLNACAIVVKSGLERIWGNFILGLDNAKNFPVKLFTNVEEAKQWTIDKSVLNGSDEAAA